MKIGTKANAIDDLGKFDGSKMTIKVNGKQIYPQKRYAIVRVDDKCPIIEDLGYCDDVLCDDCKFKENYGDTKEQLIRKVAQILFKEKIKHFIETFSKEYLDKKWKQIYSKEAYEEATKIVEFLGVE